MPHIILEYSDNIADTPDFEKLFAEIHNALENTGQFRIADIKSRAVKHNEYFIGNGDPARSFVTFNLVILSGRADQFKIELSELILGILRSFFPKTSAEQKSSVTVQISEIHKASYGKFTGPGY